MRFDSESGEFVPDLLESFSISDDGMTMTLVLPEGLSFTSGNPLDAAALKASIERYVEVSPYAFDYDGMTEIRVIDDRTLEIDNEIGFNVMLPVFITSFGAPYDTLMAEEMGDAFLANPVSVGLFRIASHGCPAWTSSLSASTTIAPTCPWSPIRGRRMSGR